MVDLFLLCPSYTEAMSIYDRRMTADEHLGTLGITHEQIANAFRHGMGLDESTPVNILFGQTGTTSDREMYVGFTAMGGGKSSNGRVAFRIIEESTRAWMGAAIVLDTRIELL